VTATISPGACRVQSPPLIDDPSLPAPPQAEAGAGAKDYGLSSRPNPLADATVIAFTVPVPSAVNLTVYDVLGREVVVLMDGEVEAGAHTATFDARGLAAGPYVYRLVVGHDVQAGRLSVMR
jgi:hypothetical protein